MNRIILVLLLLIPVVCFSQVEVPNPNVKNAGTKRKPDFAHLPYDIGLNNWLNLYIAKSDKPTPLVIWAHSNGAKANGVPQVLLDPLLDNGISFISWESVPQLETLAQVDTAERDFYKVFAWVKANAAKYNFDLKNVFISGISRGSVISWEGFNKLSSEIKGVYLADAIPVNSWQARDFLKYISPSSPKLIFSYAEPFGTKNMHTPDKAQLVVDKYKSFGIANKIALYPGTGRAAIYQHLLPFIKEGKL